MMESICRVGWVLFLVVFVLGCEEGRREESVGIVAQPGDAMRVGERVRDFDFYGPDGARRRFSSARGDVCILAVVRLDNPDVCPIAASIAMLAEKYSGLQTDVRFICVSEPPDGKCDLQANIAEKCSLKSMKVIGLCDAGGRVRTLLGVKETNVYFLIDADGKVAAMGKIDDLSGMEKALRKTVSRHEANVPGPYYDN